MKLIMDFIHFLFVMFLCVCGLNVVYELFKFWLALYKTEEYKASTLRRVLLCLSLAYIMAVIFTGLPV